MNPVKIDELKRQALKAGRGELCLVDAEDLLELLEAQAQAQKAEEFDAETIYCDAYKHGFNDAADQIERPWIGHGAARASRENYKEDKGL